MANNYSKGVSNQTLDASKGGDSTARLMRPNAKEDPETVTGTNDLKAFIGKGGKPKGPFGPQGRDF